MSEERIAILIPARLASTRLPGKVMLPINNEPVILHVIDACKSSQYVTANDVFVCTPDKEIYEYCEGWCHAVMTPETDTVLDRCALAASYSMLDGYDLYVVVQGDEPMIKPEMIDILITNMLAGYFQFDVACLVKAIDGKQAADPNTVKVIFDINNRIIYMSRQPLPGRSPEMYSKKAEVFHKQIAVMGFSRNTLIKFGQMAMLQLEASEGVDLVRYIEHGWRVQGVFTPYETQALDTQEDYEKIKRLMEEELNK